MYLDGAQHASFAVERLYDARDSHGRTIYGGVEGHRRFYDEPLSSFSMAKIWPSVSLTESSNEIHLMPSSFSTSDESVLKCSGPEVTSASGMREAWSGNALRATLAICELSKCPAMQR